MADSLMQDIATAVGIALGAGGATAGGLWLRHRQRAEEPPSPAKPPLTDTREQQRERMTLELVKAIHDLALDESAARVGDRQREATIARMAELLEQLALRGERQDQDSRQARRDMVSRLQRIERVLSDLEVRLGEES